MSSLDTFDVVIPAYNSGERVSSAVSSAFAAGADRVIVVDDGSTDDTAEVARGAGAEVVSQENAGAAAARRSGLQSVTADHVIMLDADDQLVPEGVATSREALADDPQLSAVGGSAIGVFADGREAPVVANDRTPSLQSLLSQGFAPVPPACVVWRTDLLKRALFEAEPEPLLPRYAEDYEMMVRAAMHGPLRFHTRPAAFYALEGGKSMQDPRRSIRSVAQTREYYAQHVRIPIPQWSERQVEARAALRLYKNATGLLDRSRHLLRAFVNDPSSMVSLVAKRVTRKLD